MATAREIDENGFVTIQNNPISREGVFPYLGKTIGLGTDPGKIYNVYRPAAELQDAAAQNSFKLIPWIDNHIMLKGTGPDKPGYMPAEQKGVHGTTGEAVDFRDGVLYATIKIFSGALARLVETKSQLSLGYKCKFIRQPGVYKGTPYEFVQVGLRGNHLATVQNGRSDVAVLDAADADYVFDHFDITTNESPTEKEPHKMALTPEQIAELAAKVAVMDESINGLKTELATVKAENGKLRTALDEADKEDDKKDDKKAEDEDDKKDEKKAEDEDDKKDDKEDKKAMDSAADIADLKKQVADLSTNAFKTFAKEAKDRDALAKSLSGFVGVFDHSEMTVDDVAAYGVEKLKLTAPKGQERTALANYLHGRVPPHLSKNTSVAMDAAPKAGSTMDKFLNGPAK